MDDDTSDGNHQPNNPHDPDRSQHCGTSDQATRIAADYPTADDEALDDSVHEAASRAAAAINNNGHQAQIHYLLQHGTPETDIRALLETQIDCETKARHVHIEEDATHDHTAFTVKVFKGGAITYNDRQPHP